MRRMRFPARAQGLLLYVVLIATFVIALIVATRVTGALSDAVLTLLGVVVGGTISAAAGLVQSSQAASTQIAAQTWARRVTAHQEAFTLWHELRDVIYEDEKRGEVLVRAQDWYRRNALCLSADAMDHFWQSLVAVSSHAEMVQAFRGKPGGADRVEANWKRIHDALRPIIEGAGTHVTDSLIAKLGKPPPEPK